MVRHAPRLLAAGIVQWRPRCGAGEIVVDRIGQAVANEEEGGERRQGSQLSPTRSARSRTAVMKRGQLVPDGVGQLHDPVEKRLEFGPLRFEPVSVAE